MESLALSVTQWVTDVIETWLMWPWRENKSHIVDAGKSSSNFVGVRKKSHILVIFSSFFYIFVFLYLFSSWIPGYLTHIWFLLFILDQPFLLPRYKLRGGVSERGFRRFVVFWKVSPRKFLLLIRPLLPSRLPYVFVEGKVIPYFTCSISFFGPLNLIASFQEKSMFLPFTLFRVDVELDLCSLGGTGPG